MAKRFSVQRPSEMISKVGEKLWEMMTKRKRSRNTKIVFLSIQGVTVSSGSYNKLKCLNRTGGQHRHAGDWLQKEEPMLATVSAHNASVIWMALNPDRKKRNLQRRSLFLEELGKALVNSQIQRRQTLPLSAVIVRRIPEEDAGVPSAQHTEPPAAEPGVSVWCYCVHTVYVCLFYVICVFEWENMRERKRCQIPDLSVFFIPGCSQ